jgi:hypothetical protein
MRFLNGGQQDCDPLHGTQMVWISLRLTSVIPGRDVIPALEFRSIYTISGKATVRPEIFLNGLGVSVFGPRIDRSAGAGDSW